MVAHTGRRENQTVELVSAIGATAVAMWLDCLSNYSPFPLRQFSAEDDGSIAAEAVI